jgi:hypothetical protein
MLKSPLSFLAATLFLAFSSGPMAAPQAVNLDPGAAADEQFAAPRPTEGQLNMRSLESRLRATRAIDPVSKLILKVQIDELVGRFREMHASGMSTRVSTLRQPYENMIVRVQSLLERDPLLASDIGASREALWRVLADPGKFRNQISAR